MSVAPPRDAAPSYSTLVVGTGSIGERHVRCFQKTGRAQVYVCESHPAARERVAAAYAVRGAFADLDEALDGRHYDVAVVATPAPLHVPMARRLVAHRSHVLVEKPLSTRFDGIRELQAEVERQGVTAAVAYVYRAHPAVRALRDALRSGECGEPVEVVVTSGQHFPTYRPAYRDIYYADPAQGGGALQDGITHALNAVEWCVGPVDKLVADIAHQVLPGVTVEDTVHLLTRHGRLRGSLTFNQYQAPNETTFTIVCHDGTLRAELSPSRLRIMREPDTAWEDREAPVDERDDLYVFQANAFLDAIEGRSDVLCTIEEAARTLGVTLAALRGAEGQAWLEPMWPGGDAT